jgi:hypothetical protein
MIHRRTFLKAGTAATLASLAPHAHGGQAQENRNPEGRLKLAIITTIFRYRSHSQHIGDRFIVGYPRDGEWHRPPTQVASMYVDQVGDGDLSAHRQENHEVQVYPTISEALCLGGTKLAVDGVLLIGEHGEYPRNEKGQKLYPRYEFFEQIVEVFERSGRSVPIFNDKHLSYSGEKARKMVAAAKRLGFPLLAGSSLPVTHRLPSVDVPLEAEIDEALMLGVGGSDAMDYHALEAMQCMVERRRGGEVGVRAVEMIEGNAVWKAMAERRWSPDLLEAALSRSEIHHGLTDEDSRPQNLAHNGELPRLVTSPSAYFIEYRDGLRATLLMLNGAIGDFTFACRIRGQRLPLSTLFLLPSGENVNYTACLARYIESMLVTRKAPYPVERTQIVCALLDRCLDSRLQGRRLETPEISIRYRAPVESRFCRT